MRNQARITEIAKNQGWKFTVEEVSGLHPYKIATISNNNGVFLHASRKGVNLDNSRLPNHHAEQKKAAYDLFDLLSENVETGFFNV